MASAVQRRANQPHFKAQKSAMFKPARLSPLSSLLSGATVFWTHHQNME
jgi:hypothetical protein